MSNTDNSLSDWIASLSRTKDSGPYEWNEDMVPMNLGHARQAEIELAKIAAKRAREQS